MKFVLSIFKETLLAISQSDTIFRLQLTTDSSSAKLELE